MHLYYSIVYSGLNALYGNLLPLAIFVLSVYHSLVVYGGLSVLYGIGTASVGL